MEAILEEHEKLQAKHNLARSVDDVQKTIDLLTTARETIAASRSRITVYRETTNRSLQLSGAVYLLILYQMRQTTTALQ